MGNSVIERRFEDLDNSLEADQLLLVESIIMDSKKNGVPIKEIREKYIWRIPFLDKLYEKASRELEWLNKNYFGTPHHNMDTGKIYKIQERIEKAKKTLMEWKEL